MSYQVTKAPQARTASSPGLGRTLGGAGGVSSDEEPTYDELYEEARKRGLKGRSKMSKTELERALAL
jgi:hypothetical protein